MEQNSTNEIKQTFFFTYVISKRTLNRSRKNTILKKSLEPMFP